MALTHSYEKHVSERMLDSRIDIRIEKVVNHSKRVYKRKNIS